MLVHIVSDRIGCKDVNCLITMNTQSIQTMGPLPQTPDDIIVALTLQLFMPAKALCVMHVHMEMT